MTEISCDRRNVVVTGIGWVTCLGLSETEVLARLRCLQHGITVYEPFEDPKIPITVAAPVPGFETHSTDPEDWTFPDDLKLRIEQIRAMSPNALYAAWAMKQAINQAGLRDDEISHPRTGLYAASAGSSMLTYAHLDRMKRLGAMRCSPMGIVGSIAGTLNFNLSALYGIQGVSTGFASACASSGHALGHAWDEIAFGRQDRMFVVGAEDFSIETIAPFSGMRVLSISKDPDRASRPFDRDRDGFVATGGAVVMVLEAESVARARAVRPMARIVGWGQSTDGYHVAAAHPDGAGLTRAMEAALASAGRSVEQIDYVNAHATSTRAGDIAECRALRKLFGQLKPGPFISSTKALTGHALSLSSVMEAAFCVLSARDGFVPGSAHIEHLDPEAVDLNIARETLEQQPSCILSNSSGFGGANVAIVIEPFVSS